MKKFLIGFLAAVLVCTIAVGALAATGKLSIEVNTDMKIRVNGEVFAPTDANGNPVMVFEYNGTTYAPLRALAEAYGLEVGYDAANRMATVDEPKTQAEREKDAYRAIERSMVWSDDDEKAYEQFCAMWEERKFFLQTTEHTTYGFWYIGNLSFEELTAKIQELGEQRFNIFCNRRIEDCIYINEISANCSFRFHANSGGDTDILYFGELIDGSVSGRTPSELFNEDF